ncbi:MAG TPA: ABC transporter ATP-binding protein [Ilumatobacteraceae bacterium]|jgi:branched-chain amino acid transport system ATP-binding protein
MDASRDAALDDDSSSAESRHVRLEARGISVAFGGVRALSDVSLHAAAGEICGIIGPNGAGKTTLFDVISGHRRPASGDLHLEGESIVDRAPVWRSRHGIRRTFQRQQLFDRLTVLDNLVVAQDWRGGGGGIVADLVASPTRRRREAKRRARAEEVIEMCGLQASAHRLAGQLPIGTGRLVELGRAMVDGVSVLLLDEPTSGLSAVETVRFSEVLREATRTQQCAVLLVEHDMAFIMSMSDRVVVLNLGLHLAEGTPAEVRANPAVRQAYLGGAA